MATPRVGHTTTLLNDGRVLRAGGFNRDTSVEPSSERYDPASKTWLATAPMQRLRHGHTATRLADGRVLVAGGYGYNFDPDPRVSITAEVYDPAAGSWSLVANMTKERFREPAAVLLNTGKLLVVDGEGGRERPGAEVYDPATNRWSPTPALGVTTDGGSSTTLTKLRTGRVLAVVGVSTPNEQGNPGIASVVRIYDPTTNAWTARAPMAQGRFGPTASILPSGKVLVAGGHICADWGVCYPTDTAEIFDPSGNRWSATGALTDNRTDHSASTLSDGDVLVSGGSQGSCADAVNCVVPTSELYDEARGSWVAAGTMTTPRYEHTTAALNEDRILAVGGSADSSFSPTASAEEWTRHR